MHKAKLRQKLTKISNISLPFNLIIPQYLFLRQFGRSITVRVRSGMWEDIVSLVVGARRASWVRLGGEVGRGPIIVNEKQCAVWILLTNWLLSASAAPSSDSPFTGSESVSYSRGSKCPMLSRGRSGQPAGRRMNIARVNCFPRYFAHALYFF